MSHEDKMRLDGSTTITLKTDEIKNNDIPYLVRFGYGVTMLVTMRGGPLMCLKCNQVGHVRSNCPQRPFRVIDGERGSYAAVAASVHARNSEEEETPGKIPNSPPVASVNSRNKDEQDNAVALSYVYCSWIM